MPLLTFAVLALMFLGTVLADPKPAPSQNEVTAAPTMPTPVAMTPELAASKFHGIVHAIEWRALRVTIQTDIGRLVPVLVDSCAVIEGLQVGDRVRLAVDAQGSVYAVETQGPVSARAPDLPGSSQQDHCQEAAA